MFHTTYVIGQNEIISTSKYGALKSKFPNGHITRKKLENKSNQFHFMGYAATTGVILYWKLDQTYFLHLSHHAWFD